MVKVFGSEMLDYVADEGVQIHGGYGYHEDYAVERIYRDSRINRIFEGTNEINRLLIPRMMLKSGIATRKPPEASGAGGEGLIHSAKTLALWSLDLAQKTYPNTLDQEQEVLMNLADILIETYAMESALLRARKIETSGPKTLASEIATAFLLDATGRLGYSAKNLVGRCSDDADLRANTNFVQQLTNHLSMDAVQLRRDIAASLIDHERYVI